MTGKKLEPRDELERFDKQTKPVPYTYYIAYKIEEKHPEDSVIYCVDYSINIPFNTKPKDRKNLRTTKDEFTSRKLPELKKQHQTEKIKVLKVYTTCEECTKIANEENEKQRLIRNQFPRKP